MIQDLSIEITNACPGECTFCNRKGSSRPIKHMSLDLFAKILNEASWLGFGTREKSILICGVGEPTLHPFFEKFMAELGPLCFCLGTNGLGLTSERSEFLVTKDLYTITIAIDRRPGFSYFKVVTNIHNFLIAHQRSGADAKVRLSAVITKTNIHESCAWANYWLKQIEGMSNVTVYVKGVHRWPRTEQSEHYPLPEIKLLPHPQLEVEPFINWPNSHSCRMLWDFACVQSDGSYCPCCICPRDEFRVGNLNTMTLEECYNSEVMNQYRKLAEAKEFTQIPFCKECGDVSSPH